MQVLGAAVWTRSTDANGDRPDQQRAAAAIVHGDNQVAGDTREQAANVS
jgi:hypothetical protein